MRVNPLRSIAQSKAFRRLTNRPMPPRFPAFRPPDPVTGLKDPSPNPAPINMPEIEIKKGEPIDRALKRLKSKMETEGIMDEMRRLRSFETPAQKTKRKARANAKRNKNKFRFTLRHTGAPAAAATEEA